MHAFLLSLFIIVATMPPSHSHTVSATSKSCFTATPAAVFHLAELLFCQVVLDLEDDHQSLSEFAVYIPVSSVLLALFFKFFFYLLLCLTNVIKATAFVLRIAKTDSPLYFSLTHYIPACDLYDIYLLFAQILCLYITK